MKTHNFFAAALLTIFTATPAALAEPKEKERAGSYIVASMVRAEPGPPAGCKIFPADGVMAMIYTKEFGPASYKACEQWMKKHCVKEKAGKEKAKRGTLRGEETKAHFNRHTSGTSAIATA